MSSVKLSDVLSAMSYALDLTEGQPQGHAARSCLIGMRLAEELRLPADERSDLFYALLMKDAGCSSNAARVSQLFGGNDQDAKRGLWERDWRKWREKIAYALEYTEPDGTLVERLRRFGVLALVVDAKSAFTYQHSDRVAAIAEAIAAEMALSDAARVRLRRAALLHDIGKLSVPNRILDKPGKLDEDEWTVVRTHPHFTYEILARVPVFSEFAYDASSHHERIDGRGYHRGVPGEALSQTARILAAADIFDALSAARPYRDAMPLDRVLGILHEGRGTHLCPLTVDALSAAVAKGTTFLPHGQAIRAAEIAAAGR